MGSLATIFQNLKGVGKNNSPGLCKVYVDPVRLLGCPDMGGTRQHYLERRSSIHDKGLTASGILA